MQADIYGIKIDTPRVTCYLWSPWRASALEHRLFDVIRSLPNTTLEEEGDELRAHMTDARTFRQALTAMSRVLKGWQEEAADMRREEKRGWRWLLEGDTDDHGYDHGGEPACLWAYLRLAIDRGSPDEAEKGEDIDLNGFGLRLWPEGR